MIRLLTVIVLVSAGFVLAEGQEPEPQQPAAEHQFLKRFVGEWECKNEAFMEPGQPPVISIGQMTGKMVGDFWAIVVVNVPDPERPYHGRATFGFDSLKQKKYFGTWVDSMSAFLWKYEGLVQGNKLILNSEGPNPFEPGKMVKARDTWEFEGDDLIVLTGAMEGPDGKFMTMMKATCKRKK